MNKKTLLLSLIIASILISTTVLAIPKGLEVLKIYKNTENKMFRVILVPKNPSDWSVIEDGAYGLLKGYWGNYLILWAKDLEPSTDYTLIYYGGQGYNDVWPYATCIKTITTSSNGWTGTVTADFDYSAFFDDGIGQKFWLIKSSDVDCVAGVMTAWNPTEYLFEWDVL